MVAQPVTVEGAAKAPAQPFKARFVHACKLVGRYYVSSDWKIAWLLLGLMIAMNWISISVEVWVNRWQRQFYDSIEHHQGELFVGLVVTFSLIMASEIAIQMVGSVLDWVLTIRWRRWLTIYYLDRWLARNRFYEIERLRLIDNPDQRIAEDVGSITALARLQSGVSPISWFIGFFSSIARAVVFASIMVQAAKPIVFSMSGHRYVIPYDLVWYSIAYVALGSTVMHFIGKPYIKRRMQQQHYEADFRSGLIQVRRNSEQIAFSRTQPLEELKLKEAFQSIAHNWYQLMWRSLGLSFTNHLYESIMGIIPLFLVVPRYFAGAISFGQVMSTQSAFMNFTGSLSYFIQAYADLASIFANIARVKALDDAIDSERPIGIHHRKIAETSSIAIQTTDLALRRPHGEPLLRVGDWTVRSGERWVIEGPSGAGKTTLLRAVAGLWPDGDGDIVMNDEGRAMLVPQRLYVPGGTLKEAVCFPARALDHDDATVAAVLEKVRLGVHVPHMHETRVWQEELSPGEQQRLALARILLHRPSLLVLDEATSALDMDNAQHFHESLLESLPGVTVVSVVHNDRLARYYSHRLRVGNAVAMAEPIGASP
jgi:vitamin B12/bleomycin/antimicrobial peptide transport system ATP-binding/permease protein